MTIFRPFRRTNTQDHLFSDLLWILSLTTEILSELSYSYSLGLNYLALPVVGEGIIMSKEKATLQEIYRVNIITTRRQLQCNKKLTSGI